jgi:hypothetical protein
LSNINHFAVVVDYENEVIFYGPADEVNPIHQQERETSIQHFQSLEAMLQYLVEDNILHPYFTRIDVEYEEIENRFLTSILNPELQTFAIAKALTKLRGNNTQWLIKVPPSLSMNELFNMGRNFLAEILADYRSQKFSVTTETNLVEVLQEKYIERFGRRELHVVKKVGG